MGWKNVLRQFLRDVRSQKLRAALTLFGLVWGTTAVTLLLAFGEGLQERMIKNIRGLGDNIVICWPSQTSKPWQGLPRNRKITIKDDDIAALKREVPGMTAISGEYSAGNKKFKVGHKVIVPGLTGANPVFAAMRNLIPQQGGRYVDDLDMDERRRIVFLGDGLKQDLFGDSEAVGQYVNVNGTPFLVVGVMQAKEQDSSYQGRDKDRASIPATTFRAMYGQQEYGDFVLQVADAGKVEAAKDQVIATLAKLHRFDPTDAEAVRMWDVTENEKFMHSFMLGFRIFLGVMGVLTLVVGGIGVSNINERRRRGAHQGNRGQDGARRQAADDRHAVRVRDPAADRGRGHDRLRDLVGDLRRVSRQARQVLGDAGDLPPGGGPHGRAPRADRLPRGVFSGAFRGAPQPGRGVEAVAMHTLTLIARLFRGAAKLQRKRMLLTVTAIAWGTVAIILLLSFGEGLKRSLQAGGRGLGENIVIIWTGETEKAYAGLPAGRPIRLVPDDVDFVLAGVPEIASAAGEMHNWNVQLVNGRTALNKRVVGVHPAYEELRTSYPQSGGRYIDAMDQKLKRRVVFLGDQLAKDLFGAGDPVGKTLLVADTPFTVIGVLQKKKQMGMYGGPDADRATIPLSTFEAMFGRRTLSNLVYQPTANALAPVAKRHLMEVLGAKYRFDPADTRALQFWDTIEDAKRLDAIMIGLEAFLGVIGALTLIIGGVGVANIMFAAVSYTHL